VHGWLETTQRNWIGLFLNHEIKVILCSGNRLQFDNFLFAVSIFSATALRQSGLRKWRTSFVLFSWRATLHSWMPGEVSLPRKNWIRSFYFAMETSRLLPFPHRPIILLKCIWKKAMSSCLTTSIIYSEASEYWSLKYFSIVWSGIFKIELHYITLFSKVLSIFAYCCYL